MKKSDLVAAVANAAELSGREADDAVSSTFEHITNALARGESLSLVGFGSFNVKTRAARTGRHPQTGESMEIPESRQVSFKAGKNLKEQIK